MNIDSIRADGYSYFVESIYQVSRLTHPNGAHRGMAEFPIRFADRRAGTTKISKKEIWKGFSTLLRLGVQRAVLSSKVPEGPAPAPLPSERLVPCNACGSTFQVEEYPASNNGHAVSTYSCTSTGHESHGRIVQCLSCGLVYTNPQLAAGDVLSFYSQVEDTTYLENIDARVATFKYNLEAIARLLPAGGRMLEVGSYCGMFLQIAREQGFDVLGVEPSVWAGSYARDTLGIPTVTGSIESLPAGTKPFDVVCSWDVLEHVTDPLAQLKLVNGQLAEGGIFAFSTLDYGNWYPRLMGERWPWMMDMHLYYFDQKVMKQMLARAGFEIVHKQSYSHIITFEYFLKKLAALGVPASETARALVARTPLSKLKVRFHFGDIQLYVCKKIAVPEATSAAWMPAAAMQRSA
jgi:2-polyprenyl-3-methyl-5-hydroxy-6-metoxy-1,4-benzoquinol methylase